MSQIPSFLLDIDQILTEEGFKTSDVWYHGTSSALMDSIKTQGLKRSGDKASKQATKKTMATIGNSFTETIEPVFLTQSKELAYHWACQTVQRRAKFAENDKPVVLAINLPEELRARVKPDVGAVGMLMADSGDYFTFLAEQYERKGLPTLDFDPANMDRMDYMTKLGLAYYDYDIAPEFLSEITE